MNNKLQRVVDKLLPGDLGTVKVGKLNRKIRSVWAESGSITVTISGLNSCIEQEITEDAEFEIVEPKQLKS